jgi:mRNA-degrading endonuclease toxin of MazEF toxin-antitoxin module
VKQGDVYWANIPEPYGRRPVVILTRTSALGKLRNVTIVMVTTVNRGLETEVALSFDAGLKKDSMVNLDNILTVPQSAIDEYIGFVSAGQLDEIFGAIHLVFDMPF